MMPVLLLLAAFIICLLLVYIVVYFFSHTPRKPFPSELKYKTNDDSGPIHNLPSTITPAKEWHESNSVDITVVIPCFNETKRLAKMLDEAIDFLETKYKGTYEILIIDDGSTDGTDKFALSRADAFKLSPNIMKIVKFKKNRGKGGAVTQGLLHSSGRLSLFADADGATRFKDVEKLIEFLETLPEKTAGIAIGSRAHMVNTEAVVKRSFIRNFLMYGLHALVYIFGIRDVQDTQCGFKMFNYEAIRKIFPHMHTERWIFDVEVLLLGEMQGVKLREIPVNWVEIDGSKVDLARDSIGMAIDLVVTRLAYILGLYRISNSEAKLSKRNQ